MPNNATAVGGSLVGSPETKPIPEVGQTIILQFNPYGGMHEVYGDQYYKNGTYVEVEVTVLSVAPMTGHKTAVTAICIFLSRIIRFI